MKVRELIDKLKEFDDEYDLRTGNKTGGHWVMIDFFWDGRV